MKLTKTWLSYIVWGLFSIIFFADIGIAAIEIYQKGDMQDFLIPVVSMYAYAILGVLIIYVLFKLYEKFLLKKLTTDGEPTVLKGPLEYFILVLVLFIAVSARVIAIISAGDGLEGTSAYFEYATAPIHKFSLDTYSNGAYIFGNILSFILSFLGHIERAAMGVQAGIQVITLIAMYFMVKKALGRLPAWIALLLMAFLPGSFLGVRSVTPDGLFPLFFVLFMLGLVYLCDANVEQKIKLNAQGLLYVLLGVAAAFLTYYDIVGVLAFIIGLVALLQLKNEDAWLKIQKSWLQILIFSLSYVFGLVLLLWFVPVNGLEVGPASLIGYFMGYVEKFSFNIMILSPHKGQWDSLALFILAGLWFIGFLRDKKDKAFPYALIIVVLTLLSFFHMEGYEHASFVSFGWIMLATVGIISIGVFRKNERDIAVAEKAKNDSEARKAEKERKRLAASGEKSIRLDEVNRRASAKDSSAVNNTRRPDYNSDKIMPDSGDGTRKGYGIGRKVTEEPVAEVKKQPEVEVIKHATVASVAVAESVRQNAQNNDSVWANKEQETAKLDTTVRTVVRTVDRPPVPEAPAPVPVESKPAYSQGSRSRRGRFPSKSTFTPEQLENIRRYTGMNVVPEQTGEVPTAQTSVVTAESVAEIPAVSVEPIVENPVVNAVPVIETPVVNVVPEKEAPVTGYMDLTEVVEQNDVPSNTEEVPVSVPAEEVVEETPHVIIKKPDPVINTNPALSYGSPSRRHFRHPSKSTFTPEELERISQYTGVQYKTMSAENAPASEEVKINPASVGIVPVIGASVAEKAVETPVQKVAETAVETVMPSDDTGKVIGGSRVIGSKPVPEKMEDIKSDPERKPKMIRNPLPGPKPHVAKELNYDYIPKESEMKFDIEDMKGRDYFDF